MLKCHTLVQVKIFDTPDIKTQVQVGIIGASVDFDALSLTDKWFKTTAGRYVSQFKGGELAVTHTEVIVVPPTDKVLTNTIHVYNDGSIDVVAA